MKNWNEIRPVVDQILREQRYTKNENHYGKFCFLTAYQVAVLVDKEDETLKGNLPIGGKGTGDEADNQSFAQTIARALSESVKYNPDDIIEMQFFSKAGLDESGFTFDGGK